MGKTDQPPLGRHFASQGHKRTMLAYQLQKKIQKTYRSDVFRPPFAELPRFVLAISRQKRVQNLRRLDPPLTPARLPWYLDELKCTSNPPNHCHTCLLKSNVLSDRPPLRNHLIALIILGVVFPAANGCRSRAQQDLYQQKMIREVRILEDQLYEADYKNRVLSEKLKQARIQASEVPIHSAKPARRPVIPRQQQRRETPALELTPDRNADKQGGFPDEEQEIGLSDLLPPTFDEGDPVEPDAIDLNQLPNKSAPTDPSSRAPVPLTDPPPTVPAKELPNSASRSMEPKNPEDPTTQDSNDQPPPAFTLPPAAGGTPSVEKDSSKTPKGGPQLLDPAPGGPVPPGKEDTELPPVLPGEQLPPQFGSPQDNKPPGQIELPDSVKSNDRVPDSLKIHPTLSGANRIGEKIQDILLVVNVVNDLGKTIDLNDFLIDGELSVVVLDPKREPSLARLGRWNFDHEQVLGFVKNSPVSGFHIPLDWTMDEPLGSEVIVHVRLRAEDDEMRCEAKLNVDKQRGVAGWLPRAESFR